jgi:hypothetical protein
MIINKRKNRFSCEENGGLKYYKIKNKKELKDI